MGKLKCWKRSKRVIAPRWERKNGGSVSIYKSQKLSGEKGWTIVGKNGTLKNTKSKSQALKFAKSYMKKHDTC